MGKFIFVSVNPKQCNFENETLLLVYIGGFNGFVFVQHGVYGGGKFHNPDDGRAETLLESV